VARLLKPPQPALRPQLAQGSNTIPTTYQNQKGCSHKAAELDSPAGKCWIKRALYSPKSFSAGK